MLTQSKLHVDLLDSAFHRLGLEPNTYTDDVSSIALLAIDVSAEHNDPPAVQRIASETKQLAQCLCELLKKCASGNANQAQTSECLARLRRAVGELKGALENQTASVASSRELRFNVHQLSDRAKSLIMFPKTPVGLFTPHITAEKYEANRLQRDAVAPEKNRCIGSKVCGTRIDDTDDGSLLRFRWMH